VIETALGSDATATQAGIAAASLGSYSTNMQSP
jgi:hypothetical protein